MERKQLAVLIPTYNAGTLLLETVHSLHRGGLSRDQYEILVIDNCSTDGSVNDLPRVDANGARVHLFRNAENLGRVQNWNQAITLALEEGFAYITFVFAGDGWIANGSLPQTFGTMLGRDCYLARGPLQITDAEDRPKFVTGRIAIPGESHIVETRALLSTLISLGHMMLGLPGQIYRIAPSSRPAFEPRDPVRTDQEATIDYMLRAPGSVLVAARPWASWRMHPNRFHMSLHATEQIDDDLVFIARMAEKVDVTVDWGAVKAFFLARSFRQAQLYGGGPKSALPAWRRLSRDRPGIDYLHFVRLVARRFFGGRPLLSLR